MAEKKKIQFSEVMAWIDKRLPVTETIEKHATKYPTPKNLNIWWEFGGVAMVFFVLQIVTGLFLAMHYKPDAGLAFGSVEHIMRDVNWGWLLRYTHAIGASFFFAMVYVHLFRGLYYGSYKAPRELLWGIGVTIYLMMTLTAFTGYLLPWGQMSFWGAQVITGMLTAFPVVGDPLVEWLRGGFVVADPTLNRFYPLHIVLLPGVLAGLIGIHVVALHKVGSGNPTGIDINKKKEGIPFSPFYTIKLLWFTMVVMTLFFVMVFWFPHVLGEAENYNPANNLTTPTHIVPEWYLLPFYAILRAIPDKLGGVLAMGGAIVVLYFLPMLDKSRIRSASNRPIYRLMYVVFIIDFIILGWVGKNPPEGMFPTIGLFGTIYYFAFFAALPFVGKFEDKLAVRQGKEYLLDVGIDHNVYGAEAEAAAPAPGYPAPAPAYPPIAAYAPAPAPVAPAAPPVYAPPAPVAPVYEAPAAPVAPGYPVAPPAAPAPVAPAAHHGVGDAVHDRMSRLEDMLGTLLHRQPHHPPAAPPAPPAAPPAYQPPPTYQAPPAPAAPPAYQPPVAPPAPPAPPAPAPAPEQAAPPAAPSEADGSGKTNWFEQRKAQQGGPEGGSQ